MKKVATLTKVEEIQHAIEKLPKKDRVLLAEWLTDLAAEKWDREIRNDVKQGKLKKILDEVDADIESDRLYRMP